MKTVEATRMAETMLRRIIVQIHCLPKDASSTEENISLRVWESNVRDIPLTPIIMATATWDGATEVPLPLGC